MTSAFIVRFIEQRPFDAFVMVLVNGREIPVMHPENISIGEYAQTVTLYLPNGQVEVVDGAAIASMRTLYAVDADAW
jgi:hypothetical protein